MPDALDALIDSVAVAPPEEPEQDPYPNPAPPPMPSAPAMDGDALDTLIDSVSVPQQEAPALNPWRVREPLPEDPQRSRAREFASVAKATAFDPLIDKVDLNSKVPVDDQQGELVDAKYDEALKAIKKKQPGYVEKPEDYENFRAEFDKAYHTRTAHKFGQDKELTGAEAGKLLVKFDPEQRQEFLTTLRETWKNKSGPIGFGEIMSRQDPTRPIPFLSTVKQGYGIYNFIQDGRRLQAFVNGDIKLDQKEAREIEGRLAGASLEIEERQTRGMDWTAEVGEGALDLVPFVGEFLASGGVGKIFATGARKVATGAALKAGLELGERSVAGTLTRTAIKGTGWAASGVGMALAQPQQVFKKTMSNMAPDVTLTPKGEVALGTDQDTPVMAVVKAFADTAIEAMSETAGGGLGKAGAWAEKKILKTQAGRDAAAAFGKAMEDSWISKFGGAKKEFMQAVKKLGQHGVLAEMGEERVGDLLRVVTGASDFDLKGDKNTLLNRFVAAVPSMHQLGVEAGLFVLPGLGGTAAAAGRLIKEGLVQPEGVEEWMAANPDKVPLVIRAGQDDFDAANLPPLSRRQAEELGVPELRKQSQRKDFQYQVLKMWQKDDKGARVPWRPEGQAEAWQPAGALSQPDQPVNFTTTDLGPGSPVAEGGMQVPSGVPLEDAYPQAQAAPDEAKPPEPTQQPTPPPKAPQAQPDQAPGPSLEHPYESGRKRLREIGLTEEQVKAAEEHGAFPIDATTGFMEGRNEGSVRPKMMSQAIELAKGGTKSTYSEIDLKNLTGLNEELGHEKANEVYRQFASYIQEEVGKVGDHAKAFLFRHGGDEMSAIASGATPDEMKKALDIAAQRAEGYAKDKGYDRLSSKKHPGQFGTGIHHLTHYVNPDLSASDNFSRTDKMLEKQKESNYGHGQAAAARAGSLGKQAERTVGGAEQGQRQDRGRAEGVKGEVRGGEEASGEKPEEIAPSNIDKVLEGLPPEMRDAARKELEGGGEEVLKLENEPYKGELYQGRGASLEDVYGPEAVKQGRAVPIMGKARYFAFSPEDAKTYGTVSKHPVELRNALRLTSNKQWLKLLTDADAMELHSTAGGSKKNPDIPAATKRLQDFLWKSGYDGVVVKNTATEKRLRESFGHDQVIAFHPKPKKRGGTSAMMAASSSTRETPPINVELEGSEEPGITKEEIQDKLSRIFGVAFKTGRVSIKKALGTYNRFSELVRIRGKVAGDIAVGTHEVAHHLDEQHDIVDSVPADVEAELKTLDYEPKKARANEGWAEFIRHYLTGDEAKTLAPKTHEWMENDFLPTHPDRAKQIEEAKALINEWRGESAVARNADRLSYTGKPQDFRTVGEWVEDEANRFHTRFGNIGQAFKNFTEAARDKGFKGVEDVFALFEAFNQTGRAHGGAAIKTGVFRLSDMKTIGTSLEEHLAPIPIKDRHKFELFAWANHAREVHDKRMNINPGMSLEDAEQIIKQYRSPVFEKAAAGLTEYNNTLIDMLADAGAISAAEAKVIKEYWKTYVPLWRVKKTIKKGGLGGRSYADLPPALRRRFGSGAPVYSPVQATIERTIQFYERATKQVVQNKLIEMIDKTGGMGAWADWVSPYQKKTQFSVAEVADQLKDIGIPDYQVDAVDPDALMAIYRPDYRTKANETVIRVLGKDGSPRLIDVQEDLYRALTGMEMIQVPWFLSIFRDAASLIRLGATGLSSTFALRNVAMDYPAYLFANKDVKGLKQMWAPFKAVAIYVASHVAEAKGGKADPRVKLFSRMGGELTTELGFDRAGVARFAARDLFKQSAGTKILRTLTPKNFIDKARAVLSTSDVGPRLAVFVAVLEKHGFTKKVLEGGAVPPRSVLVEATNAAADITLNFKRAGSLARWINAFVPFFNAGLRGTYKFSSVWRDTPARALVGTSIMTSGLFVLWLLHKDDDDRKAGEGWLYGGNLVFHDAAGNPTIRIPLPREWAALPQLVIAMLDAYYDKTDGKFSDAANEALKSFIPKGGSLNDYGGFGGGAISALALNKDWAGKDIVHENPFSKTLAQDEYTPYTTETMKAISEWLAKVGIQVSPAKLETAVNAQTGGIFDRTIGSAERVAAGKQTAADVPFLGGFSIKQDYPRARRDLATKLDQLEREYGSAKKKDPEAKEPDELRTMKKYKALMSELTTLSGNATNRDERFAVQKYVIGLARKALGLEPLARYPDPLAPGAELPEVAKPVVKDYLGNLVYSATGKDSNQPAAILDDLKGRDDLSSLLTNEFRQRAEARGGKRPPRISILDHRTGKTSALGKRMQKLQEMKK